MVTFDLFAPDPQESRPQPALQGPRRAAEAGEPAGGKRAGAVAARTHYRRAMAAAKGIRRARHRDLVGRQICEHLRCMLGAEDRAARGTTP